MILSSSYIDSFSPPSFVALTIKQPVSGGGGGPVLLQEEEENVAEETNDDADLNAEANKVNDNKKYMSVPMEK